jgi:hypothetical protein
MLINPITYEEITVDNIRCFKGTIYRNGVLYSAISQNRAHVEHKLVAQIKLQETFQ